MKNYNDYLPEFLGVLLALLLLNVWYLSSLTIENKVIPLGLAYFFKGATVLVGAFIGAFSAFKLNSKREEEKKYSEEKLAMNKAIFVSIRQINAIKNMHKAIYKYKTPFDRAFKLPAMKPPCYDKLKYNFDELGFLLEDYPQLMMNLVIEQERFEQALSSIEIRNDFHVKEIQPALNELELNGKEVHINDFSKALGDRLYHGAINGADTMYYHIERTDKSLIEIHKELSKISRKAFPGEKFVRWQPEA